MTDAAADTLNAPSRTASTVESGQRVNPRTQVYLYACLVIVAAIVIIPLLTTALGGFKTLGDLRSNAFGLPQDMDVVELHRYPHSASATGGRWAIRCSSRC